MEPSVTWDHMPSRLNDRDAANWAARFDGHSDGRSPHCLVNEVETVNDPMNATPYGSRFLGESLQPGISAPDLLRSTMRGLAPTL